MFMFLAPEAGITHDGRRIKTDGITLWVEMLPCQTREVLPLQPMSSAEAETLLAAVDAPEESSSYMDADLLVDAIQWVAYRDRSVHISLTELAGQTTVRIAGARRTAMVAPLRESL